MKIRDGFKFGIGLYLADQVAKGINDALVKTLKERGLFPYNKKSQE